MTQEKQKFQGRCMKCREAVIVLDGEIETKNNMMMLIGHCQSCGTKVCKLLGRVGKINPKNIQPPLNNQEQVSGVMAEVPEKVPDNTQEQTPIKKLESIKIYDVLSEKEKQAQKLEEEQKKIKWENYLKRKVIDEEEFNNLKKKEKQLPFFKIASVVAIILLAGFLVLAYQGKFQSLNNLSFEPFQNVSIDAKTTNTNNYDFKPSTSNYINISISTNPIPSDLIDLINKWQNLTKILNITNYTI